MTATLKTTVIQEPSSATANLTLNTSGGVTVGQNLTVTGTLTATGGGISGLLIRSPQVLTSGTSYTTPANCRNIFVEAVGGGGGAGGSGGNTAGTASTFTVSGVTITANGGAASNSQASTAAGGTATGGDVNITGNAGQEAPNGVGSQVTGGNGGDSILLNGGKGGYGRNGSGASGVPNGGGGGGGYAAKYFSVTPSTAYTYAIGAGGSTNGGAGLIRIWEYT